MRYLFGLGLLVAAAMAPVAATAQANGTWRVSGTVAGHAFVVDCRFEPRATGLGGVCVDAATGDSRQKAGKAHILTQGSASGNEFQWTYQTKAMLMSIDIIFTGTMNGDRMSGTMTAAGRKGTFSAVRI